jgi:hypothetical protein
MVLTVSFVLSPAIGFFVTVSGAMREHCRQIDFGIEKPGPHDFAVRRRPSSPKWLRRALAWLVVRCLCVHRISPQRS